MKNNVKYFIALAPGLSFYNIMESVCVDRRELLMRTSNRQFDLGTLTLDLLW